MSIATQNDIDVFTIEGDFDALAVQSLRPRLDGLAEAGAKALRLDMTGVRFLDSSGVGAIVFLFKRLSAAGRKLELLGVTGQPRELLKFLRIDRTIPVLQSNPESV